MKDGLRQLEQERREFGLILGGYAFFEALHAACARGLFTFLSRNPGSSEAHIRAHVELPGPSCRVLLETCGALRVVRRDPATGGFSNSDLAEMLLVSDRPHNILSVVRAYHSLIYRPMHHLEDSLARGTNVGLREFPGRGRSLYQRLSGYPRQRAVFDDWMRAVGRNPDFEDALVPALAPVLRSSRTLLDVGGGDAACAIRLCGLFPRLRATVLDLPSARRSARANIMRRGLGDRVSFQAADFLKERFPAGFDCVSFFHVLNIYAAAQNRVLLKKSFRALAPGGSVVVFNGVSEADGTGSLQAAHLSLYFLAVASGTGRVYALREQARWLREAGFRRVRSLRFARSMHGAVIGFKPASS